MEEIMKQYRQYRIRHEIELNKRDRTFMNKDKTFFVHMAYRKGKP